MKLLMRNVLFTGLLLACASTAADLPDGPGKPIIERSCTGCHRPDAMPDYRKTPEEWDTVVRRMAGRANIPSAEVDVLITYLSQNFPKIDDPTKLNINKATAEEIAAGMNLTLDEAKAIVSYRDRHGNFRAWGEMLVIYGVDGRKIQAAKDKISY
jgi:competence protein ComEA